MKPPRLEDGGQLRDNRNGDAAGGGRFKKSRVGAPASKVTDQRAPVIEPREPHELIFRLAAGGRSMFSHADVIRTQDDLDPMDHKLDERFQQLVRGARALSKTARRTTNVRSASLEIAARDDTIRLLEHQLSTVYSSRSWKLSAPIRDVVTRLRRARNLYWALQIAAKEKVAALAASSSRSSRHRHKRRGRPLRVLALGDGRIPSTVLTFDMSLLPAVVKLGGDLQIYYASEWPADTAFENADIVFMMRVCTGEAVEAARLCADAGAALIYMLDDDFSSLDPDSPLGAHYRAIGAEHNISQLMAIADLTVVWSRALAAKFSLLARRIEVFDSIANIEIFDVLARSGKRRGREAVRFGYAGGTTHAADLALIREPLLDHLRRHPDHIFESIGLHVEYLEGHPQYRHFPGSADMRLYYKMLMDRKWDFAVAPLQDTSFNAAKSDNKYREYSAAGIAAIFADVPAYKHVIRSGVNGLLASNDAEWSAALEELSTNEQTRRSLRTAASADVRARMTAQRVAEQYSRVIERYVVRERVIAAGPRHLPTFAIDINVPFRLLEEQRRARLRRRDIGEVTDADLAWADTLVIVRSLEPDAYDLLCRARNKNVKVIYSLDDNWVEFPKDNTPLSRHINAAHNQEALRKILAQSDLIKASTPSIEAAAQRFNRNVVRYPYGFDFELVNGKPEFRRDGRIRVGYFGTPGRDSQFDFVIEALKLAQRELDNLDLEFLGFSPKRASELRNVRTLPFLSDYESSIRVLAGRQWDLGLSPLVDTEFNRAKLPTKFRDYAATGAVGLYSRLPSYEDVVSPGQTGMLLSNDAEEWAEVLVSLARDQERRESMALNAFQYVRKNLSAERAAEDWMRILEKVAVS